MNERKAKMNKKIQANPVTITLADGVDPHDLARRMACEMERLSAGERVPFDAAGECQIPPRVVVNGKIAVDPFAGPSKPVMRMDYIDRDGNHRTAEGVDCVTTEPDPRAILGVTILR